MILLSDNMVDYIVRHMCWAVEGGTKVSQHPVHDLVEMANNTYLPHKTSRIWSSKTSVTELDEDVTGKYI